MKEQVLEGLEICVRTAQILKAQYPNEIMAIKDNTITAFRTKSRLCKDKSMSNSYAHYHNSTPHRICIKQKCLIDREMLRTKIKNQSDRVMLKGNFALIELMCHELAHHRTKGHAKGFKLKYKKFLSYMVSLIISGAYYL